jgi:hypothetical protein
MARAVERLLSADATPSRPALTRASEAEPPLSFAEESTWNASRTPAASARFTFAVGKRIEGPLDLTALRRAVDHIVRRHEILRTSFTERVGGPVRVVDPAARIDLPLIDVSGAANPDAEAQQVLADQARVAFDLERTPLLRLRLVRTAPAEHHLVWAVHHIVSDDWSWKVFFDELRVLYQAYRDGRPAPLPDDMPLQYGDFAAWQRRWLDPSAEAFRADVAWWGEALHDVVPPPALPFARTDSSRDARPSDGVLRWGVSPAVSRELDRLGRAAGATFFMVRLAVFAAHLALETRHDDVVVGTYSTGRRQAVTQTMIGFFSNLATLRLRVTPDLSFDEVLARARACVIEASAHSDAPYERLSEALAAQGVAVPPVRLIFGVNDQSPLTFAGLRLTTLRPHVETMPWEFTLTVDRRDEERDCAAHFDARIHNPAEVREFLARYRRFAAEVCEHPDRPVGEALAPA